MIFSAHALTKADPAEVFFEMANHERVQYKCKGGSMVDIRQDREVQKHTGGIVWETAFLLATFLEARGADKLGWCEAHDDDYCPPSPGAAAGKGAGQDEVGRERKRQKKDKSAGSRGGGGKRTRVLEVGSGCGLLGLVLSRLGCDVTLTEVPEALQNLKLNVKANMKESEEGEGEGRRARAFQLDWTREADVEEVGKGMGGGYDVVVGTDVVFSKALVDPLLRCIHSLSGPHTTVWLCLNERCRDAHAELLKRAGLFFDLVDRSEQLRETDGCSSAEELELFLFRLTRRKESPPPPPSPPAKK